MRVADSLADNHNLPDVQLLYTYEDAVLTKGKRGVADLSSCHIERNGVEERAIWNTRATWKVDIAYDASLSNGDVRLQNAVFHHRFLAYRHTTDKENISQLVTGGGLIDHVQWRG